MTKLSPCCLGESVVFLRFNDACWVATSSGVGCLVGRSGGSGNFRGDLKGARESERCGNNWAMALSFDTCMV
jgi:hypothetical protein